MSLRTRKIKARLIPYALIAPSVVLIGVFLYGVLNGVLQGFGIMPFLGMTEFTAEYYQQVLGCPDFLASLKFSLCISTISSVVAIAGGVVLSAALIQLGPARVFRVLDLSVPLMTAHALVALLAVSLFAGSGLFPRVLYACGLIDGAASFPSVVGDPSGWGIVFVYVWKEIPSWPFPPSPSWRVFRSGMAKRP